MLISFDFCPQVLDQFLYHPIDTRDELLEAYMVGHRLVQFLSSILPTHGSYFMEKAQRDRSQEQLVQVLQYLDQMAVLIDKQEHEDYIRSVLGATAVDESQTHHSSSTQSINNTTMDSLFNYAAGSSAVGGDPNSSFEANSSKASSLQQKQQRQQPAKSSLKKPSQRGDTARNRALQQQKQPIGTQNNNPQQKRPTAHYVPQESPQAFVRSAPLQNAKQMSMADESDFLQDQPATEQSHTDDLLNVSQDSALSSNVKAIAKNWPPQKNNTPSPSKSTPSNVRSPVKQQQQPPQRSPETIKLQFEPMNEFQRLAADSAKKSPSKKPSSPRKAPWQKSISNNANDAGANINNGNTKSKSESSGSHASNDPSSSPVKKRDPSSERKTIISVESPKAAAAASDRQLERSFAETTTSSNNRKVNAIQDPNTATTTTATWEESYARSIQTVPSRSPTSSVAAKEEPDEIPDPEELSLGSSAFEREESVTTSHRTPSVVHEEKKEDREEENASTTRSNGEPVWTGFDGNQQPVDESMHELGLSHESSMYSNGSRNSLNGSRAAVNVSHDPSFGSESARPLLLQNDYSMGSLKDSKQNGADSVSNDSGAYFLPFNKLSSDRNSFEREDVSFDSVDFEQGNQARSTEEPQHHLPPVVTPTESSKRNLRQTVSNGDEQLVRTKAMARLDGFRSRFRKPRNDKANKFTGELSGGVAPAVISPNEPSDQRLANRNLPLVAAYSASAQDWSMLDDQSVKSKMSKVKTVAATTAVVATTTMDMEDGDFYFSSENMRSSSSGSKDFSTAANSAGANDLLGIVKDPSPGSWQQAWVESGSGMVANDRLIRSSAASSDRIIQRGVSAGDQEVPDRRRRDVLMRLDQSSARKKSSESLKPSLDNNTTDTTTTRSLSTAGSLFSESHTAAVKPMLPAVTYPLNANNSITEMESRWDDAKFSYYRGSDEDHASFSRQPRSCQLNCGKRNTEKERSPNEHWDVDDDSSLQLLKPNRSNHFRNCVRFLLD